MNCSQLDHQEPVNGGKGADAKQWIRAVMSHFVTWQCQQGAKLHTMLLAIPFFRHTVYYSFVWCRFCDSTGVGNMFRFVLTRKLLLLLGSRLSAHRIRLVSCLQ